MEIKYLEPEWEDYSYCKIEYGDYWIETELTLFGGTRVKCRRIDDKFSYLVNWCAGPSEGMNFIWISPLIWALIFLIDAGYCPERLPAPQIKPYYLDEVFLTWLHQHLELQQLDWSEVEKLNKYLIANFEEAIKKIKQKTI